MTDHRIEPPHIADYVDDWLDTQQTEAGKRGHHAVSVDDARTLHRLAATIYASGHRDGMLQEAKRAANERHRAQSEKAVTNA